MKQLGWALIQTDQYPPKRRFEHEENTREKHVKESRRRHLNQGDNPQNKPPRSWAPDSRTARTYISVV